MASSIQAMVIVLLFCKLESHTPIWTKLKQSKWPTKRTIIATVVLVIHHLSLVGIKSLDPMRRSERDVEKKIRQMKAK
jgi:hypothetical protein